MPSSAWKKKKIKEKFLLCRLIDFLWSKYHVVITRNPESVYDFDNWILRGDPNTYTLKQAILKGIELINEKR